MSSDNLVTYLDRFMQTFYPLYNPNQQGVINIHWVTFNNLLHQKPLDYQKIFETINKMSADLTNVPQNNKNQISEDPQYSINPRSSIGTQQVSRSNTMNQAHEERNLSSQKSALYSQGKLNVNNTNITAASSPRIISTVGKSQNINQISTSSSSAVGSNNLLSKFSQMESIQSPKIQLSNLSSQQHLLNKNSLQSQIKATTQVSKKSYQINQVEEFNRHLLLSKTKELLFTLSVSTDKLNAMARLPMFSNQKENFHTKSPIKAQQINPQIQHLQSYQYLQQHQQQQQHQTLNPQIHFGYPQQNQVYQPIYVNGVKPRGSNHSAEHYSIPQRGLV